MSGRPLALLLAALFPLLLYGRSIGFDYVRADDADLIAGNQAFLSNLRNAPRAFARSYFEIEGQRSDVKTYYRPVTIVSFMVDAARAGADPHAYHATNVMLHAAVTCLLLLVAVAWGTPLWAAFVAALLFAVHPLNVQAVAWIAGRNDLLVAVFGLSSLLAWTAMARATALPVAIHLLTFGLALFSKEIGIFFPLFGILHQRLVLPERPGLEPRESRAHSPKPLSRLQWAALAGDASIVIIWLWLRAQALGGVASDLPSSTLHVAIANLPQLLAHAGKVLVPVRLNVSPGVEPIDLLLGGIAVVAFTVAAMRWSVRGTALFAACWFVLFLLPTVLVPGLPVYEHRAYVPVIGIILGSVGWRFKAARWVAIVVIAAFATLTYQRLDVFRDAFTYWADGTHDARFGPLAHVNLGQLHEAAGHLADARREYLSALERDPNTPKAHNNLGVVLMALDEPERAREQFLEETRRHPSNAEAWFNLGLWSELRGESVEARRYYQRAIAENRNYLPAYDKLGLAAPLR